ncbi:MAG: G5 domain-containing protein [Oscillospiraceae bacterium]
MLPENETENNMIENNTNEIRDNVVELSGSDKLQQKKRRIGSIVLSAAAMTAICISIAAAAKTPDETAAPADLSGYKYTTEESASASASEEDTVSASVSKRASVNVPTVTLPDAFPDKNSTAYSTAVSDAGAFDTYAETYDVSVIADGERYNVTAGGTVEDALNGTGIELGSRDVVTPDLDTALTDNMVITVQRVEYVKITTAKAIPADTEYVEDDTLPLGETAVITEGCDGRLERKYLVKRVDGEDVKSKLLSEEVTIQPVNTVIANGTYEEDISLYDDGEDGSYEESFTEEQTEEYAAEARAFEFTGEGTPASQVSAVSQFDVPETLILDENNVPLKYTQALHGKSCAYTANEGALMSTGKAVQQGYVAVNPDIIPYGTKMYIVADDGEVYGYAIAADTGGSVGRNDILVDLFMWSYDECIQWGAKNVTIYILDEEE